MAAKEFLAIIRKKIVAMGLDDDIVDMSSTTYEGEEHAEADASLRPLRTRPNPYDWPTLVIECGVSQTPRGLAGNCRWWLHNSSGAVKVVLLFFVSLKAKEIRIEQWELNKVENPQVRRSTDDEEVDLAIPKGVIKITPTKVTGAPLEISFRNIFLRRPRKKRGEHDFAITEEEIRRYYNKVWPPQGEMSSESEDSK